MDRVNVPEPPSNSTRQDRRLWYSSRPEREFVYYTQVATDGSTPNTAVAHHVSDRDLRGGIEAINPRWRDQQVRLRAEMEALGRLEMNLRTRLQEELGLVRCQQSPCILYANQSASEHGAHVARQVPSARRQTSDAARRFDAWTANTTAQTETEKIIAHGVPLEEFSDAVKRCDSPLQQHCSGGPAIVPPDQTINHFQPRTVMERHQQHTMPSPPQLGNHITGTATTVSTFAPCTSSPSAQPDAS